MSARKEDRDGNRDDMFATTRGAASTEIRRSKAALVLEKKDEAMTLGGVLGDDG